MHKLAKLAAVAALAATVTFVPNMEARAADFESIGSLQRFYSTAFAGREHNMKWFFFGSGFDTPAVWEGSAVTVANAVWPEFNGEWYLKEGALGEHWELWDSPAFDGTQAVANAGRPSVSDGDGVPGGFLIPGHPGFVQGTDTVGPLTDPRPSSTVNATFMWNNPVNSNGSHTPGIPIPTIEVKLNQAGLDGRKVELVENFWTELNNLVYFLKFLTTDGASFRYLLFKDAAFTEPVVPDNLSAVGDFVTGLGGNGAGLPTGFLFVTLLGRYVEPISPPDHFVLYDVKTTKGTAKFENLTVTLADQFEAGDFEVKKPVSLGNPADKNGEGITDPDTHLVGYMIKPLKGQPAHIPVIGIRVVNQFGEIFLDTKKPDRLLVPSAKDLDNPVAALVDPEAEHFKCYKVKVTEGTPNFEERVVLLSDQFVPPTQFTVKKPERLCNPVNKNGEGIANDVTHLLCYKVKQLKEAGKFEKITGIHINNQFGALQLDAKKPKELCVPSTKELP